MSILEVRFNLEDEDVGWWDFLYWLWEHVERHRDRRFLTEEKGYFCLELDLSYGWLMQGGRRRYDDGLPFLTTVHIEAVYFNSESVRQRDGDRPRAILFDLTTKGPQLQAATAACELPAVVDGFSEMLRIVVKKWPITGGDIMEWYSGGAMERMLSQDERDRWNQILSGLSAGRPWEMIPDRNNDREILRLWWEGNSRAKIAKQFNTSPSAVKGILYRRRRKYGDTIVPTADQLREMGLR